MGKPIIDKVTRKALRAIKPGQTKLFFCSSARVAESGKVSAYTLQRVDGIKVKVVRSADPTVLCIQRLS